MSQFGWKFRANYVAHMDEFELYIRYQDKPGREGFSYVLPLALQRLQEGESYNVPTMRDYPDLKTAKEDDVPQALDVRAFLQAAMDCAWEMGMRPIGAADATQELAAVRYHLEDMRKLAKVKT